MHGGMKVYRGAPAAARNYLDADRSRADDYYLAEGTGVARRYAAGRDGPAGELAPLRGDGYEAWVAGLDPDSRERRGRLRIDASAVRFVEVAVNGPKSWSLAAELHPDLAAAYEAAQDRAAEQIIDWLLDTRPPGWVRAGAHGGGTRPAPGPAHRDSRHRRRRCAVGIYCSSTRRPCSTRTPPARC
jgi:hypothetical protein